MHGTPPICWGLIGDAIHGDGYLRSGTRIESVGDVIALSQVIAGTATPMKSGSSRAGNAGQGRADPERSFAAPCGVLRANQRPR